MQNRAVRWSILLRVWFYPPCSTNRLCSALVECLGQRFRRDRLAVYCSFRFAASIAGKRTQVNARFAITALGTRSSQSGGLSWIGIRRSLQSKGGDITPRGDCRNLASKGAQTTSRAGPTTEMWACAPGDRLQSGHNVSQKASPDNTGMVARLATSPTAPRARATHQVIFLGGLDFIASPPFLG